MTLPASATGAFLPRLLVVDDNAENRDVLTRRLLRLGHESIESAADGLAALELITQGEAAGAPFDIVLLDVMMPRMNGVELLERLMADGRLAQTAVIMISAASEIDTVVRCIELGAEDYLPKPFNPGLLRARLGAVLEKKRLRDALARQLLRLELELAEARQQQLSMVPNEFPPASPERPAAVHAVMIPAREGGGDLYDCFEAAAGVLCLAVGDVSGKGMPAALFMARSRSLLRASALQFAAADTVPKPSAVAGVLNEELCKNNPLGMFVTLFIGVFEASTGRLAFVNAGHVRPFRLAPAADSAISDPAVSEIATRPAPPLGILPRLQYEDHELVLGRQEGLVIITDGLPDMTDAGGQLYSTARVMADLIELVNAAPDVITATLAERVHHFAGETEPDDDVTVLALRRL